MSNEVTEISGRPVVKQLGVVHFTAPVHTCHVSWLKSHPKKIIKASPVSVSCSSKLENIIQSHIH